jgi:hypothetical protein
MRTINKSGGTCLVERESLSEIQPTLWHTFSHVYHFILQAVKGEPLRIRFLKLILLENYPKNYCLFRGVG